MEIPNILITTICTVVSSAISSGISWAISKKKYQTEVHQNQIENMQRSLKFYEDLSTDTQERLGKILEENEALRTENQDIKAELHEVKEMLRKMMDNVCVNLACQIRNRGYSVLTSKPKITETTSVFKDNTKNSTNETGSTKEV